MFPYHCFIYLRLHDFHILRKIPKETEAMQAYSPVLLQNKTVILPRYFYFYPIMRTLTLKIAHL